MAHRRYSTRTDKKRWSINLVKSTSVTHSTSWILRIQWYKINLLPVSQPREPRKWSASCLSSWLFHEAISKNYETKICSVKGSPASSGNISNKLFLATKGYKYEWVCKARPAPPPPTATAGRAEGNIHFHLLFTFAALTDRHLFNLTCL